MYGKCVVAYKLIKYISNELSLKFSELETCGNEVHNPSGKIVDLERKNRKINDDIRLLELQKEMKMKRFSLLREHLSLKIDLV